MDKKFKFNIVEEVEGESKHHLFDYYEVMDKLVKLFGEPKTDEEYNVPQITSLFLTYHPC